MSERVTLKRFWISWWCMSEDLGRFELFSPWWISGSRFKDDASSICAAVEAENEQGAKDVIRNCYDTPTDLEFRFCEDKPDDWEPFTTRFPKAAWMKWPSAHPAGNASMSEILKVGTELQESWEKLKDDIATLRTQLAAAQKLADDRGAEVERLRAALRPFAEAWGIAENATTHRSLEHYPAIAKYEVSGVHFQRASLALKEPTP